MATGGTGSQLIIRAREAAARAASANALGISGPSQLLRQGQQNPMQGPVKGNQPIQPASTDVSVRDKMYAEAEEFLKGFYDDPVSSNNGR